MKMTTIQDELNINGRNCPRQGGPRNGSDHMYLGENENAVLLVLIGRFRTQKTLERSFNNILELFLILY